MNLFVHLISKMELMNFPFLAEGIVKGSEPCMFCMRLVSGGPYGQVGGSACYEPVVNGL